MAKRKDRGPATVTTATSATRKTNKWGIPNWRVPAAYGDTTRWEIVRWRWEFNRRQDDYRQEADKLLKKWGGRIDHGHPEWDAYWRKWGYCRVLDPRISTYSDDDLKTWGRHNIATMKSGPRQSMKVGDGEYAILFKLEMPLRGQLKQAEVALKAAQKERCGKLVQIRPQLAKWLGFLRALDARTTMQGASWKQYTDALYEHGLLDRHKSPSGGYRHPPPQAGFGMWESANALRFNF